jgi:riboflavin-specific deaminase-like protein
VKLATVVLNVAASLDGKIASPRRISLSGPADRRRVEERRAEADAVFLGAETVRRENAVSLVRAADLLAARAARGASPQPLQALWTRRADLPTTLRWFTTPGIERVVFLGATASDDAAKRFAAHAVVHRLPGGADDAPFVVRTLAERHGTRRLLLECGGASAAAFFAAGLVDEMRLTLSPRVLGGASSPTPADGEALSESVAPSFELVSLEHVGSEVFLHYRRA